MNFIETIHATSEPREAITFDMREMVDILRRKGQIKRVPSAYQIGDTCYIHPALWSKVRYEMEMRQYKVEAAIRNYGGIPVNRFF